MLTRSGSYIEDSPEAKSHVFPAELTPEASLRIYIDQMAGWAKLRIAIKVGVANLLLNEREAEVHKPYFAQCWQGLGYQFGRRRKTLITFPRRS